jgi:hypothetical protein
MVTALRLEGGVGDRQARDSDRLASQGIQVVLAVEMSSRQTTTARKYPPIDCSHGARESDLGRRTSGGGVVSETSDLSFATNGADLLAVAILALGAQEELRLDIGGRLRHAATGGFHRDTEATS